MSLVSAFCSARNDQSGVYLPDVPVHGTAASVVVADPFFDSLAAHCKHCSLTYGRCL